MSKALISIFHQMNNIELLLRRGQAGEAKKLLLQISKNRKLKVSGEALEKIANLYRRTQLSPLAINILHPSIKAYRERIEGRPSSDGSSRYELPCENGSVWIEARSLLKNTMQLSWITVTGN